MRAAFSETLSGGAYARASALRVQPVTLELEVRARGIVECALGAPLEVRGRLHASPANTPEAVLLPAEAVVTGTLRFLASAGLFYDLRIAPSASTPARDQIELRGQRRFVRGDLFASATTFDGVLTARGLEIGAARLRFDARDDVPRLLRSVRFGSRARD